MNFNNFLQLLVTAGITLVVPLLNAETISRFDPTVLPIPDNGVYHGVSTIFHDTPKRFTFANRLEAIADFEQSVYETNTNSKHVKLDRQFYRWDNFLSCLLYTSPSPRDLSTSRMPSSA